MVETRTDVEHPVAQVLPFQLVDRIGPVVADMADQVDLIRRRVVVQLHGGRRGEAAATRRTLEQTGGRSQIGRRDAVLVRQLIAGDPHLSKPGHVIPRIAAVGTRLVPDRHRNIHGHQRIQRIANFARIHDTGRALNIVANRNNMVVGIVQVCISIAIARRRQADNQGGRVIRAVPTQPTEVAGLNAIIDVAQRVTGAVAGDRVRAQGDGIEIAAAPVRGRRRGGRRGRRGSRFAALTAAAGRGILVRHTVTIQRQRKQSIHARHRFILGVGVGANRKLVIAHDAGKIGLKSAMSDDLDPALAVRQLPHHAFGRVISAIGNGQLANLAIHRPHRRIDRQLTRAAQCSSVGGDLHPLTLKINIAAIDRDGSHPQQDGQPRRQQHQVDA